MKYLTIFKHLYNSMKLSERLRKYIYDFLLIFSAVFGGFLADSYLNRLNDKSIEKEFVTSLIEDLIRDTLNINEYIRNNKDFIDVSDSIVNILEKPKIEEESGCQLVIGYLKIGFNSNLVPFTTRTINQLQYTGGLRLISDFNISNKIIDYNTNINLQLSREKYEEFTSKTENYFMNNFNIIYLKDFITQLTLNKDACIEDLKLPSIFSKKLINKPELIGLIWLRSKLIARYNQELESQKRDAKNLMVILKEKYNIK